AALGDDPPAVAVDRERHDRVREARPVVVEVEDRIRKGMAERMVQRFVRVRGVETFLDQPRCEMLRRLDVAFDSEPFVRRLLPYVVWRRAELEARMRVDAVGGNNLFAKILVLVVYPEHDQVRAEAVERGAHPGKAGAMAFAMTARGGKPLVIAPLLAHRTRPSRRSSIPLGQMRILKHPLEYPRHRFIRPGKRRIVRDSGDEYFSHGSFPPSRPRRFRRSPRARAAPQCGRESSRARLRGRLRRRPRGRTLCRAPARRSRSSERRGLARASVPSRHRWSRSSRVALDGAARALPAPCSSASTARRPRRGWPRIARRCGSPPTPPPSPSTRPNA